MCFFVGYFYDECRHVRFELHLFCDALFTQLQRINDPEQREQFSLPFDPDLPDCEPYCRFDVDGFPDTNWEPGAGNVLWWVYNLSEPCAECERLRELWGL